VSRAHLDTRPLGVLLVGTRDEAEVAGDLSN